MVTIFVRKYKSLCSLDHTNLFKFHLYVVQILIKCMERLQTSDVSISSDNIKYTIRKWSFAIDLQLKLFCVTVANTDIGDLKSLHTFLKIHLYHMLVALETSSPTENIMASKRTNVIFVQVCPYLLGMMHYIILSNDARHGSLSPILLYVRLLPCQDVNR